ncbi:methylated-DNA--[protein]-cysteine S-methyltransferase [Nitrosococcus wardiae]|uniref:Methylated-DNA--protein-cysteine methyltransferase n=1 Tax=Nitrosococcus wardiae TaxID=1814290 RepID=A0A4P7C5H2_9GAMM|nr:methylated-DNA--[protein]-cysteine S-methyltransferase [Nitrosococcus wardiae]QBQ56256.1 methylated-DNA--[protein]-cysteine S-methyltransferase [Nitrosococcus wardiae]
MARADSGYGAIITTPLGKLGLLASGNVLTGLDFLKPDIPECLPCDPVIEAALTQLQAYFADSKSMFTLSLLPQGSSFQKRVWQVLRTIPSGSTVSYGMLAKELNTSARAIGGACCANPLPIFIPCHRVVSRQGLGGYSGAMEGPQLDIKAWLLQHEAQGARKS